MNLYDRRTAEFGAATEDAHTLLHQLQEDPMTITRTTTTEVVVTRSVTDLPTFRGMEPSTLRASFITCPVLDVCAAAGDELGATFGVWGGRDRGTCVECGGKISLAHARPDGCCGAQCGQSWKNQRSCQVCGVRLRRRQSRACGNLCAGRLRARERKAAVA